MKHTKEQKSLHVLFTGMTSKKILTGGDQLFLDIAPRLPKNIKVIVITPHFAKTHWDNIDQSNIEFRFLPKNMFDQNDNPLLIFLSYMIRAWQVYNILKKEEEIQTIYSCSDIAYADIWPAYLILKRKNNIKWLSRIYHILLSPKNRQGNFLVNIIAEQLQKLSFRMMKKRSTTIFALNKKLYREVLELGFPKDKLEILGAGIDFRAINKFKPIKEYPYDIAVLGRVAPVKGIFDAVKIWKKVHEIDPNLKLAWIGGGGNHYQKQMNELLAENSLVDSFDMLGFLDKDEVYSILKSAKVFLCTDHENGWGLAVCEAMSCGLPVISYNLDIFGSVYQKGFKSVPLFDTDSFADEIVSLLKDDDRRKKMSKDATDQASQFDHQQVINDLVKYIG